MTPWTIRGAGLTVGARKGEVLGEGGGLAVARAPGRVPGTRFARDAMPPDDGHGLTDLLQRATAGDRAAAGDVVEALQGELRRLARQQLRRRDVGPSLQPTALVNEAWLRLFGGGAQAARDRLHFLALAATAMRCVLVDHMRSKRRLKRDAGGPRVPLDEALVAYEERAFDLIALNEALERLAVFDARLARLVELRFFAGCDIADCARILDVSPRTAAREWQTARAWLRRELE